AERFVDPLKEGETWKRYCRISSWIQINPASCVRREIPAEMLMGRKLRMLHEAMLPKITLPDTKRRSKKNVSAVENWFMLVIIDLIAIGLMRSSQNGMGA
ncbi:hypothetical protein ACTXT7_017597, partial [Hymenolepis weldensis]